MRQMPKAGYYVYNGGGEIIYTTGQRGGGGHCYWRTGFDIPNPSLVNNGMSNKYKNGWASLLWSCVHSVTRMANEYTYYPTCPAGWLDWK